MTTKNKFAEFYESYQLWYHLKRPTDLGRSGWKLGEECGEVFEALAAFDGSKSKIRKLRKKGQTPSQSISEELGDVIRVVLNLATLCNLSHEELFADAHEKNKVRSEEMLEELENVRGRKRTK